MINRQHHYEFPLDPTLLDEVSAAREAHGADAFAALHRLGEYPGRALHAIVELAHRFGRLPHPALKR